MSRDVSTDVSIVFVDDNSSVVGDTSILFVDENSDADGSTITIANDCLDESLLYLTESEASNNLGLPHDTQLCDDEGSPKCGNQKLQPSPGAESQHDSPAPLCDRFLNSSTPFSPSCDSSSSSDHYLLINSPIKHSTPHRYIHKRKSLCLQAGSIQSPTSSRSNIESDHLLRSSCCKKKCLNNLSLAELERSRERFNSKSTTEQNQFLLDSFQITGGTSTSPEGELIGMIEGKLLCCDAFTSVLNVSQKRYKRLHDHFKEGAVKYQRKPVNRVQSTKVSEAKAWMTHFFHLLGDHIPHIQQIHLPHFLTKRDVYVRMKKELTAQGVDENKVVSLSWFYKVWEKNFRNVVIPEVRITSLYNVLQVIAKARCTLSIMHI